MKKRNKIILICTACVLACALLVGGFFTWRHLAADPVKVYAVSDLGYYDSWSFSETSGGSVRTDRMQTVYLSETQQVTSILVSEGQEVKKGDILLQFDSSLTELQLAKKELEIDQKDRDLKKAKEEYNSLAGYAAYTLSASGTYQVVLLTETETPTEPVQTEPVETEPTEPTEPAVPGGPALPGEKSEEGIVSSYCLVGGDGSKDHPYLYVITDNIPFDEAFLSALLQNSDSAYVVFARCEENRYDGIVENSWGIRFSKNDAGAVSFSLFTTDGRLGLSLLDPESRNEIEEEPPIDDPGYDPIGPIGPSWEEIQQRKKELEQQIREDDISLRMLKVELSQMQKELGDGNIYAEFDGTVSLVGDPETAYAYGEPVLKVSDGGGYYIDGAISELSLSSVQEGQTVQVNAWESGTMCEGVVQSVSTTPSNDIGWSSGNPNVTYYVFTVYVDGSNNLREGEWVELNLSDVDSESAFILDNAFVIKEAGKSFVYVQGADKKLEKREITVGRELYGSSVQILGGITMDDSIAFPYSADCKPGAKTVKGTLDELYGW